MTSGHGYFHGHDHDHDHAERTLTLALHTPILILTVSSHRSPFTLTLSPALILALTPSFHAKLPSDSSSSLTPYRSSHRRRRKSAERSRPISASYYPPRTPPPLSTRPQPMPSSPPTPRPAPQPMLALQPASAMLLLPPQLASALLLLLLLLLLLQAQQTSPPRYPSRPSTTHLQISGWCRLSSPSDGASSASAFCRGRQCSPTDSKRRLPGSMRAWVTPRWVGLRTTEALSNRAEIEMVLGDDSTLESRVEPDFEEM